MNALQFQRCCFLLAGLFLWTSPEAPIARAADPHEKEKLFKAWTSRQNSVRSFKFSWTSLKLMPQGGLFAQPDGPNVGTPSDTFLKDRLELWMDGERMKKDITKHEWSEKSGSYVPRYLKGAFNGESWKVHGASDIGPLGTQLKKHSKTRFLDAEYLPLAMAYRPFSPAWCGIRADETHLLENKILLGDKECVVLERRDQKSGLVNNWWIVPDYNYSVGRYLTMREGKTLTQITISYGKDESVGWVPTAWKSVFYLSSGDKVHYAYDCKVLSYSINPSFQAEDFEIEFPVGTQVQDLDEKQTYIVREGGGKRMITAQDRGATYEQLLATESGMALRQGTSHVWIKWIALTAAVLLVLTTVVVIRNRTKRL